MRYSIPCGKDSERRVIVSLTPSAASKALEPGFWKTGKMTESMSFR